MSENSLMNRDISNGSRRGLGVQCLVLKCTLEARSKVFLPPYAGTTLRGVLGHALRDRTCVTKAPQCSGCGVKNHCIYGTLWEPEAHDRPATRQGGVEVPRGYVIEPSRVGEELHLSPGGRVLVRVVLFGTMASFAFPVVQALADGVQQGVGDGGGIMSLVEVIAEEGDVGIEVKLHKESERLAALYPLPTRWVGIPQGEPSPSAWDQTCKVELRAETPLNLVAGGQTLERFDPVVFSKRLAERLECIADVYGKYGEIDRSECADLIAKAEAVRVERDAMEKVSFQRFSNRSGTRIPMYGIIGSVILSNVHARLLALWRTAEHLHVGKQATFGFGKVRVVRARAELLGG